MSSVVRGCFEWMELVDEQLEGVQCDDGSQDVQ